MNYLKFSFMLNIKFIYFRFILILMKNYLINFIKKVISIIIIIIIFYLNTMIYSKVHYL